MYLDLFSRKHTICESGKSYYACGKGDFGGCCSKDPCTIGFCIDDPVFIAPPDESFVSTSTITLDPEDMSSTTFSSGGDNEMSSTEDSETASRTMTDSGITHTIPNNDRVTITKHTLIITDQAPSRTLSPDVSSSGVSDVAGVPSSDSSGVIPVETTPASNTPSIDTSGSPSTAIVAGAAIGGAIALAIIVFLITMFIRRKRLERNNRRRSEPFNDLDSHRDSDSGEKAFQPMSPHTTGTRGSGDPFAPFGGRADKTNDPLRPPSDTFEMDGTSAAPAELPTENYNARKSLTPHSSNKTIQKHSVQPTGPVDPRSNLNASLADRCQNTYVNHWNQYRNLGHEN